MERERKNLNKTRGSEEFGGGLALLMLYIPVGIKAIKKIYIFAQKLIRSLSLFIILVDWDVVRDAWAMDIFYVNSITFLKI